MKRTSLTTIAFLSAIVFAAGTASAQNHERRGAENSHAARQGSEHAAERVGPRVAPPAVQGRPVERAVPRVAPRYDARDYRAVRPYDRGVVVAPRVVRPDVVRPYVARPYYVRPYVLRPRFSIGFGFFAGYPVPYSYAYPYPVPVYGYGAPAAPVYVGPNVAAYGGVSLEITPSDASVYVDGSYAGLVRDFDGTQQTLTLTTGRHHIEISAPGYEPMAFDVDTVPGQIVPYRGDLQPSRY